MNETLLHPLREKPCNHEKVMATKGFVIFLLDLDLCHRRSYVTLTNLNGLDFTAGVQVLEESQRTASSVSCSYGCNVDVR